MLVIVYPYMSRYMMKFFIIPDHTVLIDHAPNSGHKHRLIVRSVSPSKDIVLVRNTVRSEGVMLPNIVFLSDVPVKVFNLIKNN